MSKAKFIQENGETILPITHEEAVLDNDGKNLPSKYQQKQDENLLTDAKTIVGAINELSTKGGGDGTITSVPYTEGSDLDIEQIGGGGSVGEITSDDVIVTASNNKTLSEVLNETWDWIQGNEDSIRGNGDWLQDVNDVAYANKGKIGETELATNDKTLTGAINELFQNVDNGKNLIATSIGEPLSAEDTFQAMSDDINGLLSTFKANMINNGVEVESNDKFKALIDKIATMSNNKGLDIISATELPATGKDNQICIVSEHTDSPILVTTNYNEPITDPTHLVYLGNSSSLDLILGSRVQIDNMAYYFNKVMFGDERLPSYIWSNNQWNELTKKYIPLFENQTFVNTEFSGTTGITTTSSYATLVDDSGAKVIGISGTTTAYRYFTFSKKINFTNFTKLKVTAKATTEAHTRLGIYAHSITSLTTSPQYTSSFTFTYQAGPSINAQNYTELTIDISSWKGELYLTFATDYKMSGGINIRHISLE